MYEVEPPGFMIDLSNFPLFVVLTNQSSISGNVNVFNQPINFDFSSNIRGLFFTYPIQIVWVVLAICLTILSLNFIGDGIGEALQSKTR